MTPQRPSLATGNPAPPGVLLIFPPLNHLIVHPELGLAQLTAWLREAGVATTALDMNASFLGDYLTRSESQEWLMSVLGPVARQRFTQEVASLRTREQRQLAALSGAVGKSPADNHLRSLVAETLFNLYSVVALSPVFHSQSQGAATLPDYDGFTLPLGPPDSLMDLVIRNRLAKLLSDTLLTPSSWHWAPICRNLATNDGVLDAFFGRSLADIGDTRPELVGLSLHSTAQLVPALHLARYLHRRHPGLHVTAGGPWCTIAAEVLRGTPGIFDYFDSVILGEGEVPLLSLSQELSRGGDLSRVPGALFRTTQGVQATPPPDLLPLEALPLPDFTHVNWALYPDRKLPFRTTRGCYWGKCTFCYYMFRKTPGYQSGVRPGAISSRHLDRLVAFFIRTRSSSAGVPIRVTLADNATSPHFLEQIAEALGTGQGLPEFEALARIDPAFDLPSLRRLHDAGCRDLRFGLETSDAGELRRIRKGIRLDDVPKVLAACGSTGIETRLFLLDYPSQSLEGYQRTLDYVLSLSNVLSRPTPLRFELGVNSEAYYRPELMGLSLPPENATNFSVFSLPFTAGAWFDADVYRDVTEKFYLDFWTRQLRP